MAATLETREKPLRFEVVEEPDSPAGTDKPPREFGLLMLGLKTLSQRAIAAIADLFFLVSVASAWYLWYLTPEPNTYQIANLTIYAAFVLAANWLVRTKGR